MEISVRLSYFLRADIKKGPAVTTLVGKEAFLHKYKTLEPKLKDRTADLSQLADLQTFSWLADDKQKTDITAAITAAMDNAAKKPAKRGRQRPPRRPRPRLGARLPPRRRRPRTSWRR